MAQKKYSDEFKKNALEQLKAGQKTLTQIERELGITHGLLRDWEAKFSVSSESGELEVTELAKLRAENRQLRRELEQLRMEREVLKKTVKIFSHDE